ncbi:MAG: aminotransferase class V-fold PLP-dependent enzyme [Zetaproteobacteria bacterium]|nr:MAG: aminotransferase class V-fold PLP-dependent enzyme [Zetaproteobacteria bacterium]
MQEEFSLDPELIYWNHAAIGVWPRRTRDAVCAFADENMRQGARNYPAWISRISKLRMRAARLIGARSADDIALVKNTSEGLSLLAYGLEWQAGDRIVIARGEFPSNRIVWESLVRYGVHVDSVDIGCDEPEAALIEAICERTRLLSLSSIQYATGLRLDVSRIGKACRERGVLFCIDAIQHLGMMRFNVRENMADMVVADGHKWLLGPEGLALMYVRPLLRSRLRLNQFGWHMVEHAGDFELQEWRPARSARRFEPGSPNMLGIHALEASLSLIEEIGMDRIEKELLHRARQLVAWIQSHADWILCSNDAEDRLSGIVSFRLRGADGRMHSKLVGRAMAGGLVCACRDGAVRLSPHFYCPVAEQLEKADEVIHRARRDLGI